MKVFVLFESNWQDYEGGGDALINIFATRARAEKAFRSNWRRLKQRSWNGKKPIEIGEEYEAIGGPSRSGLRIEEYEVVQ
jgi:hypothetical protein